MNYLTLRILDESIAKDFEHHKVATTTKRSFFWSVQFMVWMSFAINIYGIITDPEEFSGMIVVGTFVLFYSILWPIILCFKPSYTRYVICAGFCAVTVMNILTTIESSPIYANPKASDP
jgi:hypothetical protein